MKHILYSIFLLASFQCVNAQENLLKSASEYTQAIVDRDFDKVISMTLPSIVKMGGGAELMIKDLYNERQQMVNTAMDFVSVKIGNPSQMFESNGDKQVLLPITYRMVSNLSELDVNARLLGVSKNDGKSWYFLDIEKYDKESLKSFYPNLSEDIQF